MALITASVGPGENIPTFDLANERGRIAGFTIDGIGVYLGGHPLPADKDAAIRDTANLLIGVLVGLRDAAARRIGEVPEATYSGSRCCGAAEGTPHWVYCPNWRGVPENELRALAGDR